MYIRKIIKKKVTCKRRFKFRILIKVIEKRKKKFFFFFLSLCYTYVCIPLNSNFFSFLSEISFDKTWEIK